VHAESFAVLVAVTADFVFNRWDLEIQYILVRAIPSCFRLKKMCLCQVSLLSRCSPRYLTSSVWGSWTLLMWTGGQVPLRVVNVRCVDVDPLAFILHFASQLCIASKYACSLLESMAGSLSVAITAVSSAKVADEVSGEIVRSAVNSR
jgi:hypothetical protein